MARRALGIAVVTVGVIGCGGGDASHDAAAPDAEAGYPPAATVVGYGEGRWVAVVYVEGAFPEPAAAVMMASDDAVTWTETARFPEVDVRIGSAVYADGRFVVVTPGGRSPAPRSRPTVPARSSSGATIRSRSAATAARPGPT
jgi:hypothetical protein